MKPAGVNRNSDSMFFFQSIRQLLLGVFAILFSTLTAAASSHTDSAAQAASAVKAAEYVMQAKKFRLEEIEKADAQLYIEQVLTEEAATRADAAKHADTAELNHRVSLGLANDLEVRKRLFDHQLTYNALIFGLVVVVVLAGLWFSYLQFTADSRALADMQTLLRAMEKVATDDPVRAILAKRFAGADNPSAHTFEAGPVKITSSVIGLVVLAVSLAFFYLYLDRVYNLQMEKSGITPDQVAKAAVPAESTADAVAKAAENAASAARK